MTFSIVARDPADGSLGVATATAGPAVGALVPHAAADTGAIATQAMTNPYLAYDCLQYLPDMSAQQAVDAALANDAAAELRQLLLVDRSGETACWTGSGCERFAGHLTGEGVAVGGNILSGLHVLEAMLGGYDTDAPFEQRLLAAMVAGEREGGDARGTGSVALKVFRREAYAAVDLRVDWSPTPIQALSDLLTRTTTTGGYADFFRTVPRRQV